MVIAPQVVKQVVLPAVVVVVTMATLQVPLTRLLHVQNEASGSRAVVRLALLVGVQRGHGGLQLLHRWFTQMNSGVR